MVHVNVKVKRSKKNWFSVLFRWKHIKYKVATMMGDISNLLERSHRSTRDYTLVSPGSSSEDDGDDAVIFDGVSRTRPKRKCYTHCGVILIVLLFLLFLIYIPLFRNIQNRIGKNIFFCQESSMLAWFNFNLWVLICMETVREMVNNCDSSLFSLALILSFLQFISCRKTMHLAWVMQRKMINLRIPCFCYPI